MGHFPYQVENIQPMTLNKMISEREMAEPAMMHSLSVITDRVTVWLSVRVNWLPTRRALTSTWKKMCIGAPGYARMFQCGRPWWYGQLSPWHAMKMVKNPRDWLTGAFDDVCGLYHFPGEEFMSAVTKMPATAWWLTLSVLNGSYH